MCFLHTTPSLSDASASAPSSTQSLGNMLQIFCLWKNNRAENKLSFSVQYFIQCNSKGKLEFSCTLSAQEMKLLRGSKAELCGLRDKICTSTANPLGFWNQPFFLLSSSRAKPNICIRSQQVVARKSCGTPHLSHIHVAWRKKTYLPEGTELWKS